MGYRYPYLMSETTQPKGTEMITTTETAKCYYCEAKDRKNCPHGNKPVSKIKVLIHYRNASGNIHTSGASFDDLASMALQIESFIGSENLVSIKVIKEGN
jgi:hypothetical protein